MKPHALPSVRVRVLAATASSLVVAVGLAGCSSSGSKPSTSAATSMAGVTDVGAKGAAVTSAAAPAAGLAAAAPSAAAAPTSLAAAAATSGAAPAAPEPSAGPSANGKLEGRPAFGANLPAGHQVIYTSTVNVEVRTAADVATKAEEAAQDAQDANGYVFSRNQSAAQTTPEPVPSGQPQPPANVATADLVIKVPPETYGVLLARLDQLGTLLDVHEGSQDVTNQVVDTEARLTTYRESVARVRTLLTKAKTIGQIVEVEGELTRREADLESMEGQLAVLKAQTSYATITLHLQQQAPKAKKVVPPAPKKPKKPIHGFIGGLKAGGRGFATVAIGIATVIGATLPFLGVLVALALIAWFTRRYWRRSHRETRTEQPAV